MSKRLHRYYGTDTFISSAPVVTIDFLVATSPHDTFYVIPVDVLNQRKMIVVYPAGKKRSDGGLYENYREAWHLLQPEEKTLIAKV